MQNALNDSKRDLFAVLSFKEQCKQIDACETDKTTFLSEKSIAAFKIVNLRCLKSKEIETQYVD